jgi:phosphoribosylglycinamide formyltransferase-1
MGMSRFAVFASGGGTDFQSLIDGVRGGEIPAEICCLIAGRPGIYAIERAKAAGIPYEVIQKSAFANAEAFDLAVLDALRRYQADFAALAGYLSIVGPHTVRAYRNRIINIHPALIPGFCGMGFYGRRVHEAVVASGVKVTGATIHFVDETADTGPIIMQETAPVFFEDTAADVADRVLELEHRMFPRAVALMAAGRLVVEGCRVRIWGDTDR